LQGSLYFGLILTYSLTINNRGGSIMRTMIENTIKILKERTKSNLLQILDNQKKISVLLNQPVSAERTAELEEKYALNKVLLTENADFINVQLTLTHFFEKYEDSDVMTDGEKATVTVQFKNEDECFEETINARMVYNENHPFYGNDKFFQKLLNYYEKKEDYEMCGKLIKGNNITC
jgi:hypothetical protein